MFLKTVNTNLKFVNNVFRQYFMIATRSCSTIKEDKTQKQLKKQILQEHLGISYNRAAALIRQNSFIQTLDNYRLNETLKSLIKMGIENNDIYESPMALSVHSITVEHNILYLRESGFTQISAQMLLRFRSVVKKPVTLLKAHGVIHENTNVPKKLYSYLTPKPNVFPLLKKLTEENSIIDMHEEIFRQYLAWRLDATPEDINRVFKIYDKFKYKSFELISELIKILIDDLKFPKQKILQNCYLLQITPQYPKQMMKYFPTLAGVNIKKILYRYPKIIAVSPESIKTINDHLKVFGISDEAIQKCFDIYTLNPDTILYRLNEMKKIPEFEALSKNKRIVRLLLSQNKAKLRLEHLQKMKVKTASMNILCASDSVFEKFVLEGNDKTRGADIVNYLSSELDTSVKDIRKLLSNNPHWCQVSLLTIQDTLNYLLKNKFPSEEISKIPVIVLYSRNKIEAAFKKIYRHPEIKYIELSRKEILNLCLYFIESEHHFSGDGVWENNTVEIKNTRTNTTVSSTTTDPKELFLC